MLELKTAWFNGQPVRYVAPPAKNRKKRHIWFYDADILALLALNKGALEHVTPEFMAEADVNMDGIAKQHPTRQQIGIITSHGVMQLCARSPSNNANEFALWLAKGGLK
ncbi:MAG: hypothetical protein NC112_05725 [Oxalobacter formigenes]|nr:hypothetical protein [Oxalobacter formigenes]